MRIPLAGAISLPKAATDERVVACCVRRTDERPGPPSRSENGCRDRRDGRERARLDPADDRELVPSAPEHRLCRARPEPGSLRGKVPFDDQICRRQPRIRVGEERAADVGRSGERKVRDDAERLARPRCGQGIGLDHVRTGARTAEPSCEAAVGLNRDHARAGRQQRSGQHSGTGAHVHNKVAGGYAGVGHDRLGETPTAKKVPSAGTCLWHAGGGQGPSPST